MKVWIAESVAKKNRYGIYQSMSVLLIGIISVAVIAAAVWAGFSYNWPMKILSLGLCFGIAFFVVLAAMRVGKRGQRETQIFCQDDRGRLYVLDARQMIPYRRGLFGYMVMASETGRLLEEWKEQIETVGAVYGTEILAVEKMKPFSGGYRLICRVDYGNGIRRRQSYLLQDGYEKEESLLNALEGKMNSRILMEEKEGVSLGAAAGSFFVTAALVILCVAFHPAVGLLPAKFYFPCLGFTAVSMGIFIYLLVKWRRGE